MTFSAEREEVAVSEEVQRMATRLGLTRGPGETRRAFNARVAFEAFTRRPFIGVASDYAECSREHGAKRVKVWSPGAGEVTVRPRWFLGLPLRSGTRRKIERALRESAPVNVRLVVE